MPHGPGPRSDHAVGGDVALVNDAQRCQQLGLRPGAAAAFIRQGGQCIHRAEGAKVAAVVALHAPDGGDDVGRHAIAGGCRLQGGAVRRQLRLALGDALGETALSRYAHGVRVNSGWARSSSTTRGSHCALPSTSRTVAGRMPASSAWAEKLLSHWAKPAVWSASGLACGGVAAVVGDVVGGVAAATGFAAGVGVGLGADAQPARARARAAARATPATCAGAWAREAARGRAEARSTGRGEAMKLGMRHCPARRRVYRVRMCISPYGEFVYYVFDSCLRMFH